MVEFLSGVIITLVVLSVKGKYEQMKLEQQDPSGDSKHDKN